METVITEGGLRQEWKRRWAEERKVKGTAMGRVLRWNHKARVNYVYCHTNLQAWRHKLDSDISDQRRGMQRQGNIYVALVCIHGEDIGSRVGTWGQMNEPERWRKRVKDPGGVRGRFGGDFLHKS